MSHREADAVYAADWRHRLVWFAIATAVLAVAILFRMREGARPARAESVAPANGELRNGDALPRVARPQHDVMAIVNGKDISRKDLTDACIRRYGQDILESLVNKRLITNHCAKRGIAVTNEEIAAEIDRMAKRFQLGREQWLEMLEQERGVTAEEYAHDILWPTLALRKLAAAEVQPTAAEIQQAYERDYGPMVRVRLIAVGDAAKAQKLQADAAAHPENFARLAIENSEDVASASVGGMIQPIRRHMGDEALEAAAFALQPGQVSAVIPAGAQFVILKCDEQLPARNTPLASVQTELIERLSEEKLRESAHGLFAKLQSTATIQNVYNNPQLRETMPGVVATVNGEQITLKELGGECLLRHGEEVLEGEISKLLLRQALETAQVTVTQQDIDAEIRHAAELGGVVDAQGDADVKKWIETVTAEQEVTFELYVEDSVWPSAALKKITAGDVKVDEQDIRKGFEANYGERVRCRAIVLGNQRRAEEVWGKARRNQSEAPTAEAFVEYFGDLAEEYSIEPQSKALRGEVPPIGRHSGQPQLEEVAYQLQNGQLSGIIQVSDKFIIMLCEGRTERIEVDESEVRDLLHRDIYEKKLRMAMSVKFEEINSRARVDNYLAGSTHAPETPRAAGAPGGDQATVREDTAVRPTAAVE
jgi:parvulin-like peptidyl-prolyl isomerase